MLRYPFVCLWLFRSFNSLFNGRVPSKSTREPQTPTVDTTATLILGVHSSSGTRELTSYFSPQAPTSAPFVIPKPSRFQCPMAAPTNNRRLLPQKRSCDHHSPPSLVNSGESNGGAWYSLYCAPSPPAQPSDHTRLGHPLIGIQQLGGGAGTR